MKYANINLEKLQKDVLHVLEFLYRHDGLLIKCGANERCLAARFFAYIQNCLRNDPAYKDLIFDPEYNRVGVEGEAKDMGGDNKIIPDLILHKRGSDSTNILVVEFKKSIAKRKRDNDFAKLSYMTGVAYGYRYGLYIELGLTDVSMTWFQGGNKIPVLVDRFDTTTWQSLSLLSEHRQSARRRGCTLMVTRRCNLNCAYCYEPYKTADHLYDMSFDTAKEILKHEFTTVEESDRFDEIEIDFMGGEPLLNFKLIRNVVEWLEENPPPVPYICFATTNGTLVKKYKRWLSQHTATFQMGGSCDGTPEMQFRNRGGRGVDEAVEILHVLYPRQNFHMTISRATLPHLCEGVLYLQNKGLPVECSLAQGEGWNESDALIYRRELNLLAKEYLKKTCRLRPINLLARPLVGIAEDPSEVVQEKFCGTGTHMATYDYDGKCYGCHLFTPLVLGSAARTSAAMDFTCKDNISDSFCNTCVLKRICPTCAGFNYRYRGSMGSRDHSVCRMVFVEAEVASVFQSKKIARMVQPTTDDVVCAKDALSASEVLSRIDMNNFPYEREVL